MLMEQRQYTFEVAPDANKIPDQAGGRDRPSRSRVKAVNTLNVKPKQEVAHGEPPWWPHRWARTGWKKAIVTLAPGERIDVFEQV